MITYYVKQNEIYTITTTAECKVYNASGTLVGTYPANTSINIKAATNKLKLSDDNAAIKKAVSESGGTSEECEQHIANSDIHTTVVEKAKCANHIADSEVHVTVDEKNKIANAAQLTESNTFEKLTNFEGKVCISTGLDSYNIPPTLYAGINVLPLGTKTALGADAYGLHVSASGGLQLFGTHFLIGDVFGNTSLKIVNNELSVSSTDTAAISFDYANKGIFRSMPNDGTEGTYEFQCWQWADDSHTSKKEAGVKLLKASQVSELEDYSVLNKAELDATYSPLSLTTTVNNHTGDSTIHVTSAEKTKIANAAQLNSANNFRAINQFHMPLYANSDFYVSCQAQFNGTTTFNGEVFFNHVVDGYQNLDFAETIELGFVSHATCEARYVFKADSGYVQIKKPNCKAFEDQSVLNKAENDTLYAPKNYANKNFVMITDSNGDASSSSIITTTELNMLNNIRTNIQAQLDALSERITTLES